MRGPAPDVRGGGLPRSFVIFSVVLHVLAFLFAVGVPRLLTSGPSGNKVYVVDLVSLPGGAEQPAPAPPAAAAPAPEPPKPPPAKAPEVRKPEVKPEPPKKVSKPIVLPDKDALAKKTTKKPPEKKPAEPEPKKDQPEEKETEAAEDSGKDDSGKAEETATDAATPTQTASNAPAKPGSVPGAAPGTGSGAGAGPGTGAGSGDELTFYYALIKRRIEAAWKRPVSTSRETRTAAVYIELSPTGRLLKLELKTPSGYAPFDRSIVQAVRDAEPFPPFPLALKMDRLNPILEFELTPLGGEAQP